MKTWRATYRRARAMGKARHNASFAYMLDQWCKLKIGSLFNLPVVTGYSIQWLDTLRRGVRQPTEFCASAILDGIGIIEREHIAKWQQERARRGLSGRVVETYRMGVQRESH